MRALIVNGFLMAAALCVSSCGKGSSENGKLAKGQVIASVNGEDITISELNAELQGVALPAGEARKAVEQSALQKIIDRKILAGVARERKLDKTPQYLIQTRRADDLLLVNLLQAESARKQPRVSTEAVEQYIADNPSMFRERKLLIIDQIQFPMPADRKALMAYQPLKTLDEVEQKLIKSDIDYRRVPTSIDTLQLTPRMVKSILALPSGEVFIVPAGGGLTANRITETRSTPLTGLDATKIAKEMLGKQMVAQQATDEFEPLIKAARDKISYQEGYEPVMTNKPASSDPATKPAE